MMECKELFDVADTTGEEGFAPVHVCPHFSLVASGTARTETRPISCRVEVARAGGKQKSNGLTGCMQHACICAMDMSPRHMALHILYLTDAIQLLARHTCHIAFFISRSLAMTLMGSVSPVAFLRRVRRPDLTELQSDCNVWLTPTPTPTHFASGVSSRMKTFHFFSSPMVDLPVVQESVFALASSLMIG